MFILTQLACSSQRMVPTPPSPPNSLGAAPALTLPVKQAADPPVAAGPPTAPAPSSPKSSDDFRGEAQSAWEKRESRPALERSIDQWEKQLAQNSNDTATATNLARAYYLLADGAITLSAQDPTVLDLYEKGINAGERALLAASPELQARAKSGGKIEDALRYLPPSAAGALYWYATNLGRYALGRGFTTMLFYKERVFAVMQRVLAIDETFYYGAPHRYLATYYAKLPSFAGGDLRKAKEHFEKAQHINADFFATRVLWAEAYATRTEDRALFQKLLTEVVNSDPTKLPDVIPEQRLEQEKAKRLLARADELF